MNILKGMTAKIILLILLSSLLANVKTEAITCNDNGTQIPVSSEIFTDAHEANCQKKRCTSYLKCHNSDNLCISWI